MKERTPAALTESVYNGDGGCGAIWLAALRPEGWGSGA